jgi:DNA-binding MarR family transcriptional regulator
MTEPPRYVELMPELLRPWADRAEDPEAFTALNLLGEISRRVSAGYRAFLRPAGIDFSEYVLLWALHLFHPRRPSVSELRDRIVMSSGGVALALDRLERKGLARREVAAHDRRNVLVALTGDGVNLIAELAAADLDRHRRLLEPLSPSGRVDALDGLAEVLDRIIDSPDWE